MSKWTEKEIADARDQVIRTMADDVQKALQDRRNEGLHSTSYPMNETYSATGVVCVEFSDFSNTKNKLILARSGANLELDLYVGSIKNISTLRRKASFGNYSKETVRKAVDYYFSFVRENIK